MWRPPPRLLLAVELAGVGLLGALLAVAVAGTVTREVGPFSADLSLAPSLVGGTRVAVPPLGELQLDTHDGPVRLDVGINQLRPEAARSIATNPNALRGLGAEVNDDLRTGVRDLLLRTVVVTVLGAATLGLLVFRRLRRTLAAAASGVAALVVIGGVTAVTADSRSLAEPRFTGLLASAPGAVGDVRDILASVDAYGVQLGRLVVNVTDLYTVTSGLQTFVPDDGTLRVLHISDLHLNPTSYDIVETVVEQFRIDVVVDTGDSTDLGTAAELPYVDAIGRLDVPYVWIRGNHDSRLVQDAVARQPNATVLDGPEVVEVAGVRVLGQGDPRFIRDSETRGQAPTEVMERVGEQLREAYDEAEDEPHLVLTHDPATSGPLLGGPPVVLAGHTHERRTETEDGTTVLVQGSTGGAGLRALRGEDPTPVTLSVLYLDPEDKRLQAYDDITLGGVGVTDARISRTVVAEEDEGEASPGAGGAPRPTRTSG
jgi:predicted phosphodiesterase